MCTRCYDREADGPNIDFETAEAAHIISELLWIGFDPSRLREPQFEKYAPRFGMSAQALSKTWYRAQAVTA